MLICLLGGAAVNIVGGGGRGADAAAGDLLPAAGNGGVLAAVGGFRALAADLLWLEANLAWERRDAARTLALLEAVVAVDERPEYFWVNGARIIAWDLPTWAGDPAQPAAVRRAAARAHAERALRWLERAVAVRGDTPGVRVEMARIRHQVLGDLPGAAAEYGRAARLPGAPDFAARLRDRLRGQAEAAGHVGW